MPNWCYNRLAVTGEESQISEFVSQARGKPAPYLEDGSMPEEVPLCYHSLHPVPDEIQRQPYDPVRYDWQVEHWGVKWDITPDEMIAHHGREGDAVYEFLSPWAAPEAWVGKVAGAFPGLRFSLSYREEGMDFQGHSVWISSRQDQPHSASPSQCGYDGHPGEREMIPPQYSEQCMMVRIRRVALGSLGSSEPFSMSRS